MLAKFLYPARLETRTEEFNVHASRWVISPRGGRNLSGGNPLRVHRPPTTICCERSLGGWLSEHPPDVPNSRWLAVRSPVCTLIGDCVLSSPLAVDEGDVPGVVLRGKLCSGPCAGSLEGDAEEGDSPVDRRTLLRNEVLSKSRVAWECSPNWVVSPIQG
ncbi:hypothetical protein CBR_g48880 [Chara braunii]|uniref:Uncharacterized protein n=1 Tax=Chara braunii TaxID=69332 RepID=A0A388M3V8_CHABU|nr:hypothetical protein CBR_g48880 [Chara braunii]|eukprot:GBG89172.1 hypothetical protein CBR_g48880 [Chara braunii]